MTETNIRPSFREEGDLIALDDVGLTFNTQTVGPSSFAGLRNATYGTEFRMSTIPELVSLVYASLEHLNDYDTAKRVVEDLGKSAEDGTIIAGNTGVLYFHEGVYVQDNPNLREGIISMSPEALEKRLGSHEEGGVSFSEDRSIRFAPYGFIVGKQSSLEFSKNPGVIALTGSEKNAEKLARASDNYALEFLNSPRLIQVVDSKEKSKKAPEYSGGKPSLLQPDYFYVSSPRFEISIPPKSKKNLPQARPVLIAASPFTYEIGVGVKYYHLGMDDRINTLGVSADSREVIEK